MDDAAITLWQLPPCWGLPNASPYCLKVETWLRMAQIPYRARALKGPPKSPSGKAPYIEYPDGTIVCDSHAILERLGREAEVTLDAELDPATRSRGVLVQRLVEDSLYFCTLHDRWLVDANWAVTREAYFAAIPRPLRGPITALIRRGVRRAAHGQGVSRLPPGVREAKGREDIDALAQSLTPGPFLLGRPSSFDAAVFGLTANLLWSPTVSSIAEAARARPSIVAHAERMRADYWPDWPGELAGRAKADAAG